MKRQLGAKVTALGTYVPPKLLTNADLEKMIETSDQWITERTGIKQRHLVENGMATSDMSVEGSVRSSSRRTWLLLTLRRFSSAP